MFAYDQALERCPLCFRDDWLGIDSWRLSHCPLRGMHWRRLESDNFSSGRRYRRSAMGDRRRHTGKPPAHNTRPRTRQIHGNLHPRFPAGIPLSRKPSPLQTSKRPTASAVYTVGAGAVTVTLLPHDAVSAGAQWSLDGGPNQASDTTLTNIATGSHTISFTTIPGWSSPLSQTIPITNNATTSVTGIYSIGTGQGALSVTLSPAAAVSAGAQWQVDSGPAQKSGATLTNILAGSQTLSFTNIPEWNTPLSQTVTITNDASTSATGVYTSIAALTVVISPAAAISDGAQWLVDGGTPKISGATVTNLIGGPHALTFTRIAKYNVPVDQIIIITNQSTTRDHQRLHNRNKRRLLQARHHNTQAQPKRK